MIATLDAPLASQDRSSDELDFILPEELIAQQPASQRDRSRLMHVDRHKSSLQHRQVADLPQLLRRGDLLVVNDTKVIRARLRARTPSGGSAELLLIRRSEDADGETWLCLGKPRKRLIPGAHLRIADNVEAEVTAVVAPGRYQVRIDSADILSLLSEHGEIPLPPYIRRPGGPSDEDRERYQTIFASAAGAIAAPTAGLHFTPELVAGLTRAGIELTSVTLHVGPGTFLPIRDAADHTMEAERFEISEAAAAAIRSAKAESRRVIAIGTTSTRALESAAIATGEIAAMSGWADLFIRPGHRFRVIDALFTNFHLPDSTLLLLVSAFGGIPLMRRAYELAVAERYRFYSYGDAMLIE